MATGGKGWRLNWLGDQVEGDALKTLAAGWTQVGLAVEGEAKKNLWKGHGVITGTLRRSIHIAEPGYNWGGDNVEPSATSPERGGKPAEPQKKNGKLSLEVGTGLEYALYIEVGGDVEEGALGNNPFMGYLYLRSALAKVKPKIPEILRKFFEKKFGPAKT